uniref:Cadherin domain-containing protein n=1 Tax=Electrophorus electricus TaxID=8005 RepID=A0A4W4DS53_ELEEL
GSGVDEEPTGILSIDNNKGIVYVHKKIDFEAYQVLRVFQLILQYFTDVCSSTGEKVITVMATDNDDSTTPNGTFSLKIKSVTPKTDNVEFFIEQVENTNTGTIYFRGCLEYEKYTILIEAKDHGNKIQLSSTATVLIKIIDKNNHLPEITSQTVTEVLYLQVTDKDSHGSAAWKAKFQIKGDKENYFEIKTDPTTNKGILSVVKPMDYELETSRNLSVSVENEVPYFSWSSLYLPKLYPITIGVIDVNDPPEFVPRVKEVMIMENSATGTYLYTLKAIDPDKTFASNYAKGQDVDNWVNIDSKTGKVTTAKVLDRESPLLKNSTYTVLTYAVDNGVPPSTGTGTLVIHVGDENDNVPVLDRTSLVMCLSEGPTTANLTATDQDLPPFGGPFTYELQGDVKRRWKMDPNFGKIPIYCYKNEAVLRRGRTPVSQSMVVPADIKVNTTLISLQGTTVNLVKENTVYSGVYKVPIKTSDNQGRYAIQNLTVTVCDCTISASCHLRRMSGSHIAFSAMGIIVLAALLLLGKGEASSCHAGAHPSSAHRHVRTN